MENSIEKKSLGKIALDTLRFGGLFHPVYSGLSALVGNESFIDIIKDETTLYMTLEQ